ncbi:hypothetical protein V1477_009285 [Vespula maculifrons]|uniref:Uncharacterized protein n=1 Tax=Vespula maculifrons TaxID=7453 RepID=A0ABD2C9B9_VESMC
MDNSRAFLPADEYNSSSSWQNNNRALREAFPEGGSKTRRSTRVTSSAVEAAAAAAAAGAGVEAEAGASMAICKKTRDIVIDDSSSSRRHRRAVPACQRCKSFDPITLKEPTRNYRRASLGSSQSPSTAHSQAFDQ